MRYDAPGRVVLLAGGVGAARLLRGLSAELPSSALTVVVNTADDDVFHGLRVSPDIDTILYTLAGLADPGRGWGLRGDTFETIDALGRYGTENWFRLGDRDLATHLFRTGEFERGRSLSEITRAQARALGVEVAVLPMSDQEVRTRIHTRSGTLSFQEYLVRERARPSVHAIRYAGLRAARPAPGVLEAILDADSVIIAPSNPFVSIAPILGLRGIRSALRRTRAPVVAVSPLIGGRPVKGPADRMMRRLGFRPNPQGIADQYTPFLDGLLIDDADRGHVRRLESRGLLVATADILMKTPGRSAAVAREVLALCAALAAHPED